MAIVLNFIGVLIAALATYKLSVKYKQGAVRGSALVGLCIGILCLIFPHIYSISFIKDIPYVMFGGSLIGMVSAEKHINMISVLLASIVFALLFSLKSNEFNGLGGLLGITALISLVTSVGIIITFDKLKS